MKTELTIRVTRLGKYQVVPVPCTADAMSRSPVFSTEEEAQAFIRRPPSRSEIAEQAQNTEREQYRAQYAAILASADLRHMRAEIQDQYAAAAYRSKLAGDHQRAATRTAGVISVAGRDIGTVRQSYADQIGSEAAEEWAAYEALRTKYEVELQSRMTTAIIPVELFRGPVLVDSAIPSQTRPWGELETRK